MILCSCTRLTKTELHRALDQAYREDPWRFVTPGRAFQIVGRKMKCGYCARLISEVIADELARLQHASPPDTTEGRHP